MTPTDDPDKAGGHSPGSGAAQEGPCTCGPGCCSPGAQPGNKSTGRSHLKSIIFLAVIGAAVAVAAWSLVKANRGGTVARTQAPHQEALYRGGVTAANLGSVPTLAELAPGKDFGFVLLAGDDPQQAATAAHVLEQVSKTLAQRGVQAATVTVKQNDAGFQRMARAFAVDKLPAVVLLGKGGPSIVAGDITEDGILRDYVRATCASACGPGACSAEAAKSGCCSGQ
jgi:hypothetical protein